jgi:hypothetical protein
MGQRSMPMPYDIAKDDRDLPPLRDEHVIEVASRRRAIRRPIGNGDGQAADTSRNVRHERRLHRIHVSQQRRALTLQASSAPPRHARASREADHQ